MDMAVICGVFAQLDRELWVVTACAGNRRGGLIATFVSQASLCPLVPTKEVSGAELGTPLAPRVLVGLARQHHTWNLVHSSAAFALHLLGEEHLEWVWRFGLPSSRNVDKFEGLAIQRGVTGSPILTQALTWLDCRVEARLETGDRTVFLAEVVDGQQARKEPLLTVQRMARLASADQLQQLKELLAQDSAVDAAAIAAWRQEQRGEA